MSVYISKIANVWSQIKHNFQPLKVVGRGSETQLQVGENTIKKCSTLRITLRQDENS